MPTFSFDIVSDYDKAEINNVYDQVKRELLSRYDFKNTPASVEWLTGEKTGFLIIGMDEWQVEAILDIIRKKLALRNVSQKILDTDATLVVQNLRASLPVTFKKGINQETAKKISSIIRSSFPKIKVQILGESLRVTSASKNELQATIQLLKSSELDVALQFINYR